MRITFNTNDREASRSIAQAAEEMALRQRQVASGRRLTSASDDPVAASAVVTERTELAVTEQYRQASDTVTSRLSVLDTMLSTLVDETTTAKVILQSARGSVPAAQREAAAERILAVRDSIFATVNTQYRGGHLFSGNNSTTAPYTRVGDAISAYQGTPAALEMDIDRQTSVRVALSADDLLRGGEADDLFATLSNLAAAVRAGTDTAALDEGGAALDRAFERFNRALGRVGADLAQIDAHQQLLSARRLAGQTKLNALENVDLAEAISAMNQAETAYRAALGAVATTSRLSLLDYLR